MISVLIPFAGNDPDRITALKRVMNHYLDAGYEVCVGVTSGPWCKAHAVDRAAQQATGDIYVITDADCLADIHQATAAVADGAPWATPHNRVRRLGPAGQALERHQAVRGGGIVVLTRDTYRDIPLDPRFIGWGHEDLSWGLALDCLAGPCARGDAELVHLWHPPQERTNRRIGSQAGRMLERRYWQARTNPTVMRPIIDEAREALWTQPVS